VCICWYCYCTNKSGFFVEHFGISLNISDYFLAAVSNFHLYNNRLITSFEACVKHTRASINIYHRFVIVDHPRQVTVAGAQTDNNKA